MEQKKGGAPHPDQAFIDEYGELVKNHKKDFAHYPMLIPDGQGGFRLIVQATIVPAEEEAFIKKDDQSL